MDLRMCAFGFTHSIFAHIASFFLTYLPSICDNVEEVNFCARIRHIASYSIGVEIALVNFNVLQSDVS